MARQVVSRGCSLVVYGPARVVVETGRLFVAGTYLEGGGEVVVKAERGASFYAVEDSTVDINVGGGGGFELVCGAGEVVQQWMAVVERLREAGYHRIMVVGPVDSGKSTMTTWIRNMLKLDVIEADIGQNELGTPCCVSLARYNGSNIISLQDLEADYTWFVGHVSADRVPANIVAAISRAVKRTTNFVMDTDGYVQGRGILFKTAIASAAEVEAVVAMGGVHAHFFRGVVEEVISAPPPPKLRRRSPLDRRAFRERQYYRLFSNAYTITLDLQNIPVENLCITDIPAAAPVRAHDYWVCQDKLVVVAGPPLPQSVRLDRRWAKGLIAGLRVDKDYDILAIVESIRVSEHRMVVRASRRVDAQEVKAVILGYVRLDDQYREVEKLEPNLYPLNLAPTKKPARIQPPPRSP